MARRDSQGGCLGCATLLALVVALAVAALVYVAPPYMQGILSSAERRVQDVLSNISERISGQTSDEGEVATCLGFEGQKLSEEYRDVYAQLFEGISAYEETFAVFGHDVASIEVAFRALMRDHPEIFWLDGSLTYTHSTIGSVTTVTPGLAIDLASVEGVRAQIEAEADAVLASVPAEAGEYGIAKAAYDYVIASTTYDLAAPQSQNIMSVFLYRRSVCAGYARSFQYLLQRAGMFCAYVEGSITDQDEDHAWNLVRIDGEYAYVDVTWGDPAYLGESPHIDDNSIIYDYLCVTTDEIARDGHVFADPEGWPTCTSLALDYYRRSGRFFDVYDEAALANAFWAQVNAGERTFAFKFADDASLATARAALESGTFLVSDLSQVTTSYSYTVSDALRVVKVYW